MIVNVKLIKEKPMTLQAKLDQIKAGFQDQADAESLAIMGRAAEQLAQSDILDGVLAEGERMPEFKLTAAGGGEISSRQILAQGPLVLTFYRGLW
jgi:hypothetical protein